MTRRAYRGRAIEVSFDQSLCIHATECVRGLPAVFDRERRPWISANSAAADEVGNTIERCPSGALQFRRLDGNQDESPPEVTTIAPTENGPLPVRGDLLVRREDGSLERMPRATLCGCGQSGNKPFCDNSHLAPTTNSSVVITVNKGQSRFELHVDGRLAGYATYEDTTSGRGFEHTFVVARYRGRGLAGQLVSFALDKSRAAGQRVLPFCPFVREFIKTHEEYLDLVDQPQHFALSPRPLTGEGGDHLP